MEEEKIKQLFSNFNPQLSSSSQFMTKLQKNMEALEIVKQYQISMRKRNQIAVAVAAISGFVVGVIFTLLFPIVGNWISTIDFSLPFINTNSITINLHYIYWIVMASLSVFTAWSAYDIVSKLGLHRSGFGRI